MKSIIQNDKVYTVITVAIVILAALSCFVGIFSTGGNHPLTMTSALGEEIRLYGEGLYARNSFSMAVQAIAQDYVTLILVLPCTMVALFLTRKKNILGEFILTGLLAYLLYTYMSYSFLMYYNSLFLVYVALMALSFYGFLIGINRLLANEVVTKLEAEMKTKGLRVFLFITGIMIGLMWLGRIIPTIGNEIAPEGLDNYATLVIQAMDLGIIVPACFVISYLLKIKNRMGYILGPVIIVKAITLVLAVLSMGINMAISGVYVAPIEFVVFGIIFMVAAFFFVKILKTILDIAHAGLLQ